jgi:hypothetical protein
MLADYFNKHITSIMIRTCVIAILFLLLHQTTAAAVCQITAEEKVQLISMSYDAFDQAPEGWRRYGNAGCYHETGILIDEYLTANQSQLLDWQQISVIWHAGQMYAFNDEYDLARDRFQRSINPNEPADTHILWNDYVYATLAFLNHDKETLIYHRERIANGPIFQGQKPNLDVVDRLILHFGKPYSAAY